MASSNQNQDSIYTEYIQLTKKYQEKYGKNTIVLLQVGAFFEVYGFRCPQTGEIQDSAIQDFVQICNLNVSEKKATHGDRQVLMAGFRDYTLDKYLQKITENGFSAPVFVQEKEGKTIRRVLDSVHSPGTYISCETDVLPQMTNNIACIWLDIFTPKTRTKTQTKPQLICGTAIANIFTGKSFLTEFQQPFIVQPTTFDELERIITVYNPSEILLIYDSAVMTDSEIASILQFSGIQSQGPRIHYIKSCDEISKTKIDNCRKQKYISHILTTFFGETAFKICSEFQTYPTATQAFCFLLNFVQEHNPNLVRGISMPEFHATSGVILANHTLKQLNFLESVNGGSGSHRRLSSVASFLNHCCSPMGKRLFHKQLVSPTTDETWLNQEYKMTKQMLESATYEMVAPFRKILGQVRDMEKICRQLVMGKIYPSSIYYLYDSIGKARQIWICLAELPKVREYLISSQSFEIICETIGQFLEKSFWLDRCKTTASLQSFDSGSIIRPGICEELDRVLDEYEKNGRLFDQIHRVLNDSIRAQEPSMGADAEYVKVHETEKSGSTLQITKKRGLILKAIAQKRGSTPIVEGINWNEIRLKSASTSNDEIEAPLLSKICRDLLFQKDALNRAILNAYRQVLGQIEEQFYGDLENIADFLAKVDVLQCKAYIAEEFHYCCPEIVYSDGNPKSFIDVKGLRHVLIEHIQTSEIYVANDVDLGSSNKTQDGILLYGTNAVGKTSFIRAIGIAVIMAQAGLYVPCSQFRYRPYTAIFSRILGNDDLFKGLSTFAVEMSELRVILKMADEKSLILGDELCSGTETESALSIFVAGLMELHEKGSSFIFATHFHEIVKYQEIQDLSRLALKHMAVHYDRETDRLIYDRKLRDGPGNRMYGLEVCKSMHLPTDFLERAYQIRGKYFPESRGELLHNPSRYNAGKIRGKCEICKSELGTETHHVQEQCLADDKGWIENEVTGDVFHKNHPANLKTVCEACHLKIHHPK
jgi:DNA mismatch repair protein MutS